MVNLFIIIENVQKTSVLHKPGQKYISFSIQVDVELHIFFKNELRSKERSL